LKRQGYALRGNRKRLSPRQDAQRDQQFRYIARQRRKFAKAKLPIISVDTKKKELIGAFKNPGRTWRRQPLDVLATDFPQDAEGKAMPYGVYDLGCNTGYVVGSSMLNQGSGSPFIWFSRTDASVTDSPSPRHWSR